jgi:hypothetical protein
MAPLTKSTRKSSTSRGKRPAKGGEMRSSRLYRDSGFEARFGRKSIRSSSETAGLLFSFQGFATPKWTIFAISLWDAADLTAGFVE